MNINDDQSVESCLEDLKSIRKLLVKHEERPLLEYWAFFSWGLLIAACALLHQLLIPAVLPKALHSYILLWGSCGLAGGLLETIALFRQLEKSETALFTRKMIKPFITFLICLTAVIVLLFSTAEILTANPAVLLLIFSILISFMAHFSYASLNIEAATVLVIAIILIISGMALHLGVLFYGLLIAGFMLVLGIHSRFEEKRHEAL